MSKADFYFIYSIKKNELNLHKLFIEFGEKGRIYDSLKYLEIKSNDDYQMEFREKDDNYISRFYHIQDKFKESHSI